MIGPALAMGTSFWTNAFMWYETLLASSEVIHHRSLGLRHAAMYPWRVDWSELGRMGPEKAIAFSAASVSLFQEFVELQQKRMASTVQDIEASNKALGRAFQPIKSKVEANRCRLRQGNRLPGVKRRKQT